MPLNDSNVVRYQVSPPNFSWTNLEGTSVSSITKPGTPISEGTWEGLIMDHESDSTLKKFRLVDAHFMGRSETRHVKNGQTITGVLGGFTIVFGTLVAGNRFRIEWNGLQHGVQP